MWPPSRTWGALYHGGPARPIAGPSIENPNGWAGPHRRVGDSMTVDAWITLSRLSADLLALTAKSVDLGWTLLAAGAALTSWVPSLRTTDLKALGLDPYAGFEG